MSGNTLPSALQVAVNIALGAALGLAYFHLLRWNLRLWLERRRRAPGMLLLALRLLGVAAAFAWVARGGAWPVLLTLGGFLAGRAIALRRVRAA